MWRLCGQGTWLQRVDGRSKTDRRRRVGLRIATNAKTSNGTNRLEMNRDLGNILDIQLNFLHCVDTEIADLVIISSSRLCHHRHFGPHVNIEQDNVHHGGYRVVEREDNVTTCRVRRSISCIGLLDDQDLAESLAVRAFSIGRTPAAHSWSSRRALAVRTAKAGITERAYVTRVEEASSITRCISTCLDRLDLKPVLFGPRVNVDILGSCWCTISVLLKVHESVSALGTCRGSARCGSRCTGRTCTWRLGRMARLMNRRTC